MTKTMRNIIKAVITFVAFSNKQKKILTWWCPDSPYKDYNGIIADGSIRAGKTVSMALSFVFWAMDTFDGQNFAMCGKTVGSFRRNVWAWLKPTLIIRGYGIEEIKTENLITITRKGKINYFYVFGGRDESSQDLIQGLTLAGIFFDEVALMPESFVNQATGRCSIDGAKLWFNCNPGSPMHYIKTDWIEQAKNKKLLHLHFTMDDNPSLSEATKERYKLNYKGVFYQRFILGLWVIAQGAIYGDVWSDDLLFDDDTLEPGIRNNKRYKRYILIDYGIVNPTAFLDIIDDGKTWWVMNEWYYGSKEKEKQLTNAQLADELEKFIGNYELKPKYIVIDPSAAAFKAELRARHWATKEIDEELVNANNRVLEGIQKVNSALAKKIIRVHKKCVNLRREILSYVWDDGAIAKGQPEKPIKINDHTCDALRYGVHTLLSERRILAA